MVDFKNIKGGDPEGQAKNNSRKPTVIYEKTEEGWKSNSPIPTERLDEEGNPKEILSNEIWVIENGKYLISGYFEGTVQKLSIGGKEGDA